MLDEKIRIVADDLDIDIHLWLFQVDLAADIVDDVLTEHGGDLLRFHVIILVVTVAGDAEGLLREACFLRQCENMLFCRLKSLAVTDAQGRTHRCQAKNIPDARVRAIIDDDTAADVDDGFVRYLVLGEILLDIVEQLPLEKMPIALLQEDLAVAEDESVGVHAP